jgi:hypothetical protein
LVPYFWRLQSINNWSECFRRAKLLSLWNKRKTGRGGSPKPLPGHATGPHLLKALPPPNSTK